MALSDWRRFVLQGFNYAVFMALVGYFATHPAYHRLAEDDAVLTLAFGHTSKRVSECKPLTNAQVAELAPNMRAMVDCPRERSPLTLEVSLDEQLASRVEIESPGLYNDQSIDVYREIVTRAGEHRLIIRMNDDVNVEGPTYVFDELIQIQPSQRVVVSFDATQDGFSLE
jgi:hypothetical protein